MKKLIGMLEQYREVISYLVFGVLTTVVSFIFYFIPSALFGLPAWSSSIISWIFAVSFAYVTNKRYVFESKAYGLRQVTTEIILFFGARLVSLGINVAIMFVFVDWYGLNELLFFIISQVVVMVMNYVFSKLVIFRK